MKCDELKNYDVQGVRLPAMPGKGEFVKRADVDAAIAELKAESRKLKRALWLARAYRGYDNSILLPSKFMRKVWDSVERKCRAKAEEYK